MDVFGERVHIYTEKLNLTGSTDTPRAAGTLTACYWGPRTDTSTFGSETAPVLL